ncbi:hypothetical protein [Streptomyces europaeiscabiei]|uniref:hypothetical protein n=1 Tax=Streptomyces europaeiscabiei TaxID=146819 RepID=UPI0039908938
MAADHRRNHGSDPPDPGRVPHGLFLFTASDASWITEEFPAGVPNQLAPYITDGPQLPRTPDGSLLMPWSTYEKNVAGKDGTISGGYVQTYAPSKSGGIEGPWQQHRPLVREDSGIGMLFHTFDGRLMMILHRPFENARGKPYEMELAGQELRVLRRRADLDGGGRRRAALRTDKTDRTGATRRRSSTPSITGRPAFTINTVALQGY